MLEFQSQIHFKKIQSWLEERFDCYCLSFSVIPLYLLYLRSGNDLTVPSRS